MRATSQILPPPSRALASNDAPSVNTTRHTAIRRLSQFGWTAVSIARLYGVQVAFVRAVLAESPADRKRRLMIEWRRRRREQERAAVATAEKAARRAASAERDVWRGSNASAEDTDRKPPLATIAAAQVELEPPAPAPPREPTRNAWVGSSRFQEGMSSRKLSPDDRQRVHKLRAEGLSTGELAQQFKITRAAICYQLARPPLSSPAGDAIPSLVRKPPKTREK